MAPPRKVAVTRSESTPAEQIDPYWARLREAGLEPLDAWQTGATLDSCAGLVLTGGRDIHGSRYGEQPHPRTDEPDRVRDELEFTLLEQALASDLPVLAICRGHQLLNVWFGGRLLQRIESGSHAALEDDERSSRSHEVVLSDASRLKAWIGHERSEVNSRHHQAVTPEGMAPGLRIAATSTDGLVEAVESEHHTWVVGVQWHPERFEPRIEGFVEVSKRLFEEFARAVSRRQA